MKSIICISDTHNKHHSLQDHDLIPDGDILIHAGDATGRGTQDELVDFIEWYGSMPHEVKILIAGNHDWGFEKDPSVFEELCETNGIVYLNDSGYEHDGIKFWGSPIQPNFFNWAFNRDRGADILKHWNKIPRDTDVLITHGPPEYILDLAPMGGHVGCADLLNAIQEIQPQLHIFGHIHEGRGTEEKTWDSGNTTTFINASSLDGKYRIIHIQAEEYHITRRKND